MKKLVQHGTGYKEAGLRGFNENDNTKIRVNLAAFQDSTWAITNTNAQCYGCTDIYILINLLCITYQYSHIQPS
jgi:hypothetical protein